MLVVVPVECLVAEVAAIAEPSLVVLQVLKAPDSREPLEFPDFQELECQPFPVGTR